MYKRQHRHRLTDRHRADAGLGNIDPDEQVVQIDDRGEDPPRGGVLADVGDDRDDPAVARCSHRGVAELHLREGDGGIGLLDPRLGGGDVGLGAGVLGVGDRGLGCDCLLYTSRCV